MIEYLRLVRLYAAALAAGAFLILAVLTIRPESVSPAITAGLLAGTAVFVISSRLSAGEEAPAPVASLRLERTPERLGGGSQRATRGWLDVLAERERVIELRLAIVRSRRLGTAGSAEG